MAGRPQGVAAAAASRAAWWREPMMWLVLGGPLVVVVASFATLALALKHPDPVLGLEADDTTHSAQPADFRTGQPERGSTALVPALQARNHAATGGR